MKNKLLIKLIYFNFILSLKIAVILITSLLPLHITNIRAVSSQATGRPEEPLSEVDLLVIRQC